MGNPNLLSGASAVIVYLAVLFFAAPPVGAQDATFWSFLRSGQVVTRCHDSTAVYEEAKGRLQRVDEQVRQLKNADPPAKVAGALHDLLKTECFLPAAETERLPEPDTSVSLKDWWTT